MTKTSIVLLFGSEADAGAVSAVSSDRSRLQTIVDEAPGAVDVHLISFGPVRAKSKITSQVNLGGSSKSSLDIVLRAFGAFALRRKFASFPLGRLLNSLGPVDQGRVFWRAVRRDAAAWATISSADIAIAADLPAAKTAWIVRHRNIVKEAHFDPRSAEFGDATVREEPRQP